MDIFLDKTGAAVGQKPRPSRRWADSGQAYAFDSQFCRFLYVFLDLFDHILLCGGSLNLQRSLPHSRVRSEVSKEMSALAMEH